MTAETSNEEVQSDRPPADEIDTLLLKGADEGCVEEIKALLRRGGDACYQDETDGKSVLMAAAASGSVEAVQELLNAGAPWNAFDKRGRCAGEYALEAGHQEAADLLLEAGVRAELLLAALERRAGREDEVSSSAGYLRQRVEYGDGGDGEAVLMDEEEKAVMMAWEGPLMEAHAATICSRGGDVLNIGFGLGLVDEAIQRRMASTRGDGEGASTSGVTSHTIVEAHPDVYKRMLQQGWDKKPGVRIVFGRWQDVIGQLGQYDGVFFDTYSEFYEDLRTFQAHLPKLLKKDGLYSYFNGLAADNPFFHAVCCEVSRRELAAQGLAVQFVSLPINVSDPAIWKGIQNKYWQLDTYYLPVGEWE